MDRDLDLSSLPEGTPVIVGTGAVPMPRLSPGDSVLPVAATGELLVIPDEARAAAEEAVADARAAFDVVGRAAPGQISDFFLDFAARLADDAVWDAIAEANTEDVDRAKAAGRLVGRLRVSDKMRDAMIAGLEGWAKAPTRVGEVLERRNEEDFSIERRRAPLGVVAFVFEGRPNVFADGAGVLRNGNTAVMRIGGDALGTAEVIESRALVPALTGAGLPSGAVRLVRSRDRAAGQALFTIPDVRLAIARGSGPTVALLGSIAETHGIPASLHGTGGAWIYLDESADPVAVENVVRASLDRKVCNTLNVLLVDRRAADRLGPSVRTALDEVGAVVHVARGGGQVVAGGRPIDESRLGHEWEWDDTPELTVALVDGLDDAVALTNRWSPNFVASIVTSTPGAFDRFYEAVEAPYVGNGFTRWVDGQWAWHRPELGLTNWERGRLLGRSGILSGDDITTVRDVFVDHTGKAPQAR